MPIEENKQQEKTDIVSLLKTTRTYGSRDNKAAEGILVHITGDKKWTHAQGMSFYEFILRHYIDNETDLRMILAVSGILDGYRTYKTADKRRVAFLKELDNLKEEGIICRYTDIEPDTLRKAENDLLSIVAKRLQEDIDSHGVSFLLQLWEDESSPKQTKKPWLEFIAELKQSICNKPFHWLIAIIIVTLIFVMLLLDCLSTANLTLQNIAIIKMIESGDTSKDQQQPGKDIPVQRKVYVEPGGKKPLWEDSPPNEINLEDLHSSVDNDNIVAVTNDWYVVGLDGLGDKESDSTIITIYGDGYIPATVYVTVKKKSVNGSGSTPIWEQHPELD